MKVCAFPYNEFNKTYYKLNKNKLNKENFLKINRIKKASLNINFEFENNKSLQDKKAIEEIISQLYKIK